MRITHLAAALAVFWVPFACADHPAQGMWEGQIELLAERQGAVAAHHVSKLQLVINKHGRIEGVLPDKGCRLLGMADLGQQELSAGITVSGCEDADLNGRFSQILWAAHGDSAATMKGSDERTDSGWVFDASTNLRLMANLTRVPQHEGHSEGSPMGLPPPNMLPDRGDVPPGSGERQLFEIAASHLDGMQPDLFLSAGQVVKEMTPAGRSRTVASDPRLSADLIAAAVHDMVGDMNIRGASGGHVTRSHAGHTFKVMILPDGKYAKGLEIYLRVL